MAWSQAVTYIYDRELLQANEDGNGNVGRQNPYILLSKSLLWLHYVSIFAEIPLTPASPTERNVGR